MFPLTVENTLSYTLLYYPVYGHGKFFELHVFIFIHPSNGDYLLNGVLINNLLNNLLASWLLINLNIFLPQKEQFSTSINLFCLVTVTVEFVFTVLFLQRQNMFPLFLHSILNCNFPGFLISSFISLYFLSTVCNEGNWSRLVNKSNKTLEIKP